MLDLSRPPETVAEFFKLLSVPAAAPAVATPAAPAAPAVAPAAQATPPIKLKVPARARPAPPPEFTTPLVREILAVNPSPRALEKAVALKFSVGTSNRLGNLRLSTTSLRPPPGMTIEAANALLQQNVPGEDFSANRVYRPYRTASGVTAPQSDGSARDVRPASQGGCDSGRCYGPPAIGWTRNLGSCARDVRIGLVDTTVDLDHPAFRSRRSQLIRWPENPTKGATDPHGTSVLSILAGDPASGTPGLVPDATFFIADVFRVDENGQPFSDTTRLLAAFDWLLSRNVAIINLSLTGPADDLLKEVIVQMSRKGVLFVAAAGNGGPSAAPSFPAAYPEVVAVTAVGKNLRAYLYANRGDYIDVAAPGVDIWGAIPGHREGLQSGTSFAVPYVTAVLAAMPRTVRNRTKQQILAGLPVKDLGPPGKDLTYGRGLLQAPSACEAPDGTAVASSGWSTIVHQASSTNSLGGRDAGEARSSATSEHWSETLGAGFMSGR